MYLDVQIYLPRFGKFSLNISLIFCPFLFLFSIQYCHNLYYFPVWCPINPIGFPYSFLLFFSISPLNNFKWLAFDFPDAWSYLKKSAPDALYCIFFSFHSLYSSAIEFLFVNFKLILLSILKVQNTMLRDTEIKKIIITVEIINISIISTQLYPPFFFVLFSFDTRALKSTHLLECHIQYNFTTHSPQAIPQILRLILPAYHLYSIL